MPKTPDEKKAYKVWLDNGEGATVVFAKSRNEAKMTAMAAPVAMPDNFKEHLRKHGRATARVK